MSIRVLCLNPAVDKLYAIDGFRSGEVYTGQIPRLSAGGKGVNVARVLSQLGEAPALYAFLGDTGGEAIEREMRSRCACTFVRVPGVCRTTVNIADRALGCETVISEAGPRVEARHVDSLLDALLDGLTPGDTVCCSGSIIAGAPQDIYARISRLCESRGAACALDCNARTLGPSLQDARYTLGKPNARELADHLGLPPADDPRELARRTRRLMPPYDALLVSAGARGGVLVTEEGAFSAAPPPVRVGFTVGCGDAAFAGALHARSLGLPAPDMLRLAMACGAACASGGEPGSVNPGDVEALYARIEAVPLNG